MLKNHRVRTEKTFPFTAVQTEDVIFVNEKTLASLDYVIYQTGNDGSSYNKLKKQMNNKNNLNTHQYLERAGEYGEQNLYFKDEPQSFFIQKQGQYFESEQLVLLGTSKDDAQVEAQICFWKIDNSTHMIKKKEISFHYDAEFMPSTKK